MAHKFDPSNWERLESPERREALPPERVLSEIGLKPGQTIVDVGTGSGYFAVPAAELVGPHGKVYAVDISSEMLEIVAQRMKGLSIELVLSQETVVPLDDEVADHVFMSAVFHEILPKDRTAFLAEMKRMLRVGGTLAILEWAPTNHRKIGPPEHERLPQSEVEVAMRSADFALRGSTSYGEHFYLVLGQKC